MILFGTPNTPPAQPRNLFGGHLIGGLTGCSIRLIFGEDGETFLAVAIAAALTLFIMQITGNQHPPAGATAVIALVSPKTFPWAGFQYVITPVLSGCCVLFFVALTINNLASSRHYPIYWY